MDTLSKGYHVADGLDTHKEGDTIVIDSYLCSCGEKFHSSDDFTSHVRDNT